MKGFTKRRTTTITLERDGEQLVFDLTAPLHGYIHDLQTALGDEYKDDKQRVNYDLGYLLLGACLGTQLESPVRGTANLREQAAKVRNEMATANLSEAEIHRLMQAALDLNSVKSNEVADAAKNSGAPAGAGQ